MALHPAGAGDTGPAELEATAAAAGVALERHLDRCALAPRTVTAYRRQARAYLDWLTSNAGAHPDAFADQVGAEAAVTAWRRHLIGQRAGRELVLGVATRLSRRPSCPG